MSTPTDPQEVARMVAWLRNGDLPLSTCVAIADTLERLAAQVLPEGHTILDGQEWLHDYTFPRSGSMSDSITVRLVPVAAGTAPTPDDPRESDPREGE